LAPWRWREVVAGDEVGKPFGCAEAQAVRLGERGEGLEVGWAVGSEVGQVAEEVLEPGWADQPFTADRWHRRFWTWHSLCAEHGLSNREAVEAMTALAVAMAPQQDANQ
jgi:hypothetical protein